MIFFFFSFLDKWAGHPKKIKDLLKHMYMKCFTDNFGWCSSHLKKILNKENQTNVKLPAAHQYGGAPQCCGALVLAASFVCSFHVATVDMGPAQPWGSGLGGCCILTTRTF